MTEQQLREMIREMIQEATGFQKFPTVMIKDFKNKKGFVINKGEPVELEFADDTYKLVRIYKKGQYERKGAVLTQNLHKWVRGATKPPGYSAMEKMAERGIAKSVLGKKVEPDGLDPYGSPSWLMALGIV